MNGSAAGDGQRTRVKRRLPPLVLPDGAADDKELKTRLKYFTSSSHAFDKWSEVLADPKRRKFAARNGFHQLFWSAILLDQHNIMAIIETVFADNIVRIGDHQFEATFGLPLNTSAVVSDDQLLANYFLLFSLPAKSQTRYLEEWMKRRLKAFVDTARCLEGHYLMEQLSFKCRPELFVVTKQRFFVYKNLVPALSRYAIDYPAPHWMSPQTPAPSDPILSAMFMQIRLVLRYSGLQVFYLSYQYMDEMSTEGKKLEAVKADNDRLVVAVNTIVDKYGIKDLPYVRLLGYPEAEALDRRHYPDLAVCAHFYYTKQKQSVAHLRLKYSEMDTKTPLNVLKTKARTSTPFWELFPNLFHKPDSPSLPPTFTNLFEDLNLDSESYPDLDTNTSDLDFGGNYDMDDINY